MSARLYLCECLCLLQAKQHQHFLHYFHEFEVHGFFGMEGLGTLMLLISVVYRGRKDTGRYILILAEQSDHCLKTSQWSSGK